MVQFHPCFKGLKHLVVRNVSVVLFTLLFVVTTLEKDISSLNEYLVK